MADNFGLFWNSINADRTYDADSFAEWLRKFFTTGVFNGEMQVTPDSGMVVNVAPGYANIDGKVRFFESAQAFTIEPASGVYPRIDSIVVRSDSTARAITCEYVKGDYSGETPTAPTPTRAGGVYEIVLAQIYVSAGATAIMTNDITDTRANDELCGWVTSTVEGVPMDQIVSQMQADFLAWYDRMKGQLSEDAAGNLQLEIDNANNRIEEVNTNIESEIGDTDISAVGDGTLTGAISTLNNGLASFQFRKVSFPYSIAANGNAHGNLYTLINNNMPSGYRFLAFAGFNTASVNVFMSNCRYANSDYSLELRNVSTSAISQTSEVFYLCGKV